jgi:hypothetical protein
MPLTIGDKLSPYEILAPIGAGGIEEVGSPANHLAAVLVICPRSMQATLRRLKIDHAITPSEDHCRPGHATADDQTDFSPLVPDAKMQSILRGRILAAYQEY